MSRKKEKQKSGGKPSKQPLVKFKGLKEIHQRARELACRGDHAEARRLCQSIVATADDPLLRAQILNDMAVLDAAEDQIEAAIQGFAKSLEADPNCNAARENLTLVRDDFALKATSVPISQPVPAAPGSSVKVAIVSFLFNYPTRGGGNIHTAELTRFLARSGFSVRHFYPRFEPWGIGRVEGTLSESEALDFAEADWNASAITARFRRSVDAFAPDYVLITDAWNFKPHLARAMRGYPVLLRFQALECLCPLNNVRLLMTGPDRFEQCPRHQLATLSDCTACLRDRAGQSGGLHQVERALAGVGTAEYHALLTESLREAEAVLVLNPLTQAMLSPYASRVEVVTWGMDPARFPWRGDEDLPADRPRKVIFQAGVLDEPMKGFNVLHAACVRLWQKRKDFELVATGEPAGKPDEFTRLVGWVGQDDLPRQYREADIVAVPTVAQEGLSRTSVEAMAAGRPVVASRIGGLPFTVAEGATGLLCEPGNEADLAEKLATLLDDFALRRRMGLAGRRRFEAEFTWPVVIDKYYRPLLKKRVQKA